MQSSCTPAPSTAEWRSIPRSPTATEASFLIRSRLGSRCAWPCCGCLAPRRASRRLPVSLQIERRHCDTPEVRNRLCEGVAHLGMRTHDADYQVVLRYARADGIVR